MPDTRSTGYKTTKVLRLGTETNPATVYVQTEERDNELKALASDHGIFIKVIVSEDQAEDTRELDSILNKTTTQINEKVPSRNDPCLCGSGKKYKKCCAA